MDELISIITPSYNSAKYITETIESVICQSYTNWELLITDDCSSDSTIEVIKNYLEKDSRIKLYVLDKNSGAGVARNNSIKNAKGDYLTFIDSDDLWDKNFLFDSINLCKNNNYSFVFSSYHRRNEDFSINYSDFIVPTRVSYNDVLKSCPISCLTAFIDIKKLGKKYMPLLKKRQDAALWLSYLKEIDYAYGIKNPLAVYRIRKESLSRNKLKVIKYQWQLYRKSEKLSVISSLRYIILWAYYGYKKYSGI